MKAGTGGGGTSAERRVRREIGSVAAAHPSKVSSAWFGEG